MKFRFEMRIYFFLNNDSNFKKKIKDDYIITVSKKRSSFEGYVFSASKEKNQNYSEVSLTLR